MADFLAEAGRIEEAISAYKGIINTEPADARPLFGLAKLLRRRGDTTEAIDTLRKAYERADERAGIEALAKARTAKDYDDAQAAVVRDQLGKLEDLAKERYVSPLDLARLHAEVGHRQRALAILQQALTERSPALVFLKADRAWDAIRDDPRFASIVREVGIP